MQIVCGAGAIAQRTEPIVRTDTVLFEKHSFICANSYTEGAIGIVGMLCENEHHHRRPQRGITEYSHGHRQLCYEAWHH